MSSPEPMLLLMLRVINLVDVWRLDSSVPTLQLLSVTALRSCCSSRYLGEVLSTTTICL